MLSSVLEQQLRETKTEVRLGDLEEKVFGAALDHHNGTAVCALCIGPPRRYFRLQALTHSLVVRFMPKSSRSRLSKSGKWAPP